MPLSLGDKLTTWSKVDDINPDNLKTLYLFGLEIMDKNGNAYPDAFFLHHLSKAVQELERLAKIRIQRTAILDDKYDYDHRDYAQFAYLKLSEAPILSVEEVRLVYPTGAAIFKVPPQWIRLYPESGQVHLVPTAGTLSAVILSQGGSYLPLLYQGLGYLPQLFRVDYTCGMDLAKIPYSVIDAIFKLAAVEILRVVGDVLYPPGSSSLSIGIDGLSQSQGHMNPPFRYRIESYQADLFGDGRTREGAIKEIKTFYHGIDMRVA